MLKTIVRIFSKIFILLSVIIPTFYFLNSKEEIKKEKISYQSSVVKQNQTYYAFLSIPKINLLKELPNINSKNNDISKNIFIAPTSQIPNNLILASHSGASNNAYFKDLYKLNLQDEIKLYYKNYEYIYEILEIEYQPKTGTLLLKNNYNLKLVTCTHKSKKTQTIYYANLKNMTKIS